jgi:hypothetical protein
MTMNRPIAAKQNNYIRLIFHSRNSALPGNTLHSPKSVQIPLGRTWAENDGRTHFAA